MKRGEPRTTVCCRSSNADCSTTSRIVTNRRTSVARFARAKEHRNRARPRYWATCRYDNTRGATPPPTMCPRSVCADPVFPRGRARRKPRTIDTCTSASWGERYRRTCAECTTISRMPTTETKRRRQRRRQWSRRRRRRRQQRRIRSRVR